MSQEITKAQADILLSQNYVNDAVPLFYANIGGATDINVSSFNISRDHGAMAQSCSLTIPNVNPTDPVDTGYYNEGRNDAKNNKPQNAYNGVIIPGSLITVKMGYGDSPSSDTVTVFTGTIDTVKISISGTNSEMYVYCRGTTKKMVDNPIQCQRVVSGEIFYHMNYPVNGWAKTGEELIEFYLTKTDTNPLLLSIWIDACERAGFTAGNLVYDTTWVTRLADVAEGSFTNCTGTWIQLAQKVVDLLGAYMYEDEYGKIYLKVANNQSYSDSISVNMSYSVYNTLHSGYARAVEESIVVSGYSNSDWEYDYASDGIRISSGSSISEGQTVGITFTYCAWKYNPTQVSQLTQWVSHDDTYGTLAVRNIEKGLKRTLTTGALGDGSSMSTLKVGLEDKPELLTNAKIDDYLINKMTEMKKNYFNLSLDCIAIPQLRVRDIICCVIFGTITALYEITGFTLSYDASTGMTQTINAVYYASSNAI